MKKKKLKTKLSPLSLSKLIAKLAVNKKAENVIILDLRKVANFCDYFIIMTGSANTHVETLTSYIVSKLKQEYGILPHHIEGEETNQWVVIDYITVVVNIMLPEIREFYALERIWAKGKKVLYERKSKKSTE